MAGDNGLDEDYLAQVADLPTTSTTTNSDASGDSDGATGTSDGTPTAKTKSADNEAQSGQGTDKQQGQAPNSQQPPQADPNARQVPLQKHVSGNFVNQRGDIVDGNGKVVASAGITRRFYEENGRLRQQVQQLTRDGQTSQLAVGEARILNGIPQQYGLSNDDVAKALDLAGRMKRGDVVSVAQDIIAMITAQGHNVSDLLGKDIGDSIDMKAITRLIDQRLGPIQQQREETTRQAVESQRVEREATTAYNRFLDENPNADIHQNEIAEITKANGISPQLAYNQLMSFIRDNNLDPEQPLLPQLQRSASGQAVPRVQTPPADNRQRPMPNGDATLRNGGQAPLTPVFADPDEDWGSIIKRAQLTDTQH